MERKRKQIKKKKPIKKVPKKSVKSPPSVKPPTGKKRPKKAKSVKKSVKSDQSKDMTYATLSAFFNLSEDPRKAQYRNQMEVMCGGIQEYLSNFILIGYTLDGLPVNITHGNTCKDYDSLNTALHKYIIDNYTPPPPPGQFP